MSPDRDLLTTPRIQSAIDELQGLIRDRYPAATFSVGYGDDPGCIYLTSTVDVEDRNDVIDTYIDRLVDLRVDEVLPLHVVPVRPPARIAAMLRDRQAAPPAKALRR